MENNMFCYQCQETAGCKGCTRIGVCGKTAQVAAMQDLLVYVSKGISAVTTQLRKEGKSVPDIVNHMVMMTNAAILLPSVRLCREIWRKHRGFMPVWHRTRILPKEWKRNTI